jgi:hypothetical protein
MEETVRCSLSWEEVRDAVAANAFERLGRLPEQLAIYHQHTQAMRREFVTVGDYILHHHFGFTCRTRPEDGRKYVQQSTLPEDHRQQRRQQQKLTTPDNSVEHDAEEHSNSAGNEQRVVWARNDFPYALADDIGHFLLWSLKPIEPQQRLEQIIREHVAADEEFVYFVNPPALQSVHNVCHVHVLVHHDRRQLRRNDENKT